MPNSQFPQDPLLSSHEQKTCKSLAGLFPMKEEERTAFSAVAEELAKVAREFYHHGRSPATSTNFSVRMPGDEFRVAVTRSGVDKSHCLPADILLVDESGKKVGEFSGKPSAETPLHLAIYQNFQAGSVLHTHSVVSTVASYCEAAKGKITFANLEILKGLFGITTHETSCDLPIFANTQDMDQLGRDVAVALQNVSPRPYGILIAGHGLYAWGKDLAEAKRHVEVYEFLLECMMKLRSQPGWEKYGDFRNT